MGEVFLDTSFAVALVSPRDAHHQLARHLSTELVREKATIVTTRAVVMEIGNSLSRLSARASGINVLSSLEADPRVTIEPLTEELFAEGFRLFRERADKAWSLTDCVSFIVMQHRGIADALTADEHFRQAGFRPLMLA